MFEKKIGIDLGTSTILIYMKGKGIVLKEPSIVAMTESKKSPEEVGQAAQNMLGRVPEWVEVTRPLRDGVIANYKATEMMLEYFINKLAGSLRLFQPEVMISTPVGITSVERRAVEDAATKAARKTVYTIPAPLAAAIGANLPFNTPTGNMLIDIGGGTSEAAVISMRGIVTSKSIRVAGMKFDDAIASYIRRNHNLVIGEQTAEEIKIQIGSAIPLEEPLSMEVKGRDQVTGLPKTIKVASDEVTMALNERLVEVSAIVKNVLEATPPELASDIIDRGVTITGGSALLRNIDTFLTHQTGIPCYVADNPIACVALGAGLGLEIRTALERATITEY